MALYIDRLKAGGESPEHISYGGGLLHKVVFKPSGGDEATVWERGVLEVSPDGVTTGYAGASKSVSLTASDSDCGLDFPWTASVD